MWESFLQALGLVPDYTREVSIVRSVTATLQSLTQKLLEL